MLEFTYVAFVVYQRMQDKTVPQMHIQDIDLAVPKNALVSAIFKGKLVDTEFGNRIKVLKVYYQPKHCKYLEVGDLIKHKTV